jgi:peptidoglycan hydrolase-like protein with peptidoglycan-binding domain
MALQSPLLLVAPSLSKVLDGAPSLKPGSQDAAAVRALQCALHALGAAMPRSFPNGYEKPPDGKYGDETYQAVIAFQKALFPKDPGQWDGRVGKLTLGAMDRALVGKGPAPNPNPNPPNPNLPKDDSIPTGPEYASIPGDLMTILQRSYRERDAVNLNLVDGFDAKSDDPNPQSRETFKQVLDRLKAKSNFPVLLEMRTRLLSKAPLVYGKIRWLSDFYDFTTSRGIWCSLEKDSISSMHAHLRDNPAFCADMIVGHSTHQKKLPGSTIVPSQCYRELGVMGNAGLHICLQATSQKASGFGEWQNIHVDPHQIGNAKTKKCACWYGQTKHHFGDVGKWCVKWFLDNHKNDELLKNAIRLLGANPNDPDDCYDKFMAVVGDYDTFVDMGDHPEKYPTSIFDPKKKALVLLAGVYRKAYMEFMPPQFPNG